MPEVFGLCCTSQIRVQVVVGNGRGYTMKLLLTEELEVVGEIDPETVEYHFSLKPSLNGNGKPKNNRPKNRAK